MFITNNSSVKKHIHIVHVLKLTLQKPKCPLTSPHKHQNLTCSFIYRQADKECQVFLWQIINENKNLQKIKRKPPTLIHNLEITTHK
jgi:hypothetical protein